MNEINVVLVENRPVRFIPVVEKWSASGRSGDWHGWSYSVVETKTGKLVAGIVSWSSVQGERDYLHTLLAQDAADLYQQLNLDNFVHRLLAQEIALAVEVVPTV